jgi:hypothetical protein
MWNLLSLLGYKIPLITSIIFRGDYHTSSPEERFPFIREYDHSFQHILGGMQLKENYSGVIGGAIHSIMPVFDV